MKHFLLLTLLIILILLSGCTAGNIVKIGLDENATTGYQWSYVMDVDGVLKETKDEFKGPVLPLVGAGGKHVWQFVADGDGIVTLTFTHAQGWSGGEVGEIRELCYEVKNNRIEKISELIIPTSRDFKPTNSVGTESSNPKP